MSTVGALTVATILVPCCSTECAIETLVSPDHHLFSFVEFAFWLCACSDELGIFDGVGFRAARCQGKVLLRFADATRQDCTEPSLVALARMLT